MRPRRSMPVASAMTSAAPELASMPRGLMCQSEATPSSALYWHMGETTTRFASSRSASRIGENRALVMSHASIGEREEVGRGRPYRRPPGGSSCRATGGFGGEAGLLREDFVLRTRRDRGPALAQLDGLAHA